MPASTRDGETSVRTLDRALDVLGALERAGQPLRLSDVARLTGIHKATTQRLLHALEQRGYVQREDGRYQVGVAVVPLAHAFLVSNPLGRAALPVLQELASVSGGTVSLFVRLDLSRVVVQRVEGREPLRYTLPIGQRLPLHLGGGKVIAAALPPNELQQLLAETGTIRLATGQQLSREDLLAELDRVRRQGYAVSVEERTLGAISVAAPIPSADGQVRAGVSLVGLPERMPPQTVQRLAVEVRRAAHALAERYAHV